jgi:hypothetical protein
VPEEWEIEGPAVSISLGEAADLDPALLAAICGPDGLGGALGPQFGQDQAADALRPGPVLAAATSSAPAPPPATPTGARRDALDAPVRPNPHHHPHQLRNLTPRTTGNDHRDRRGMGSSQPAVP